MHLFPTRIFFIIYLINCKYQYYCTPEYTSPLSELIERQRNNTTPSNHQSPVSTNISKWRAISSFNSTPVNLLFQFCNLKYPPLRSNFHRNHSIETILKSKSSLLYSWYILQTKIQARYLNNSIISDRYEILKSPFRDYRYTQ